MKRLFLAMIMLLCLGSSRTVFAHVLDEGYQAFKAKDYKKAAELMRPLAEKGDPYAQDALGFLYMGGLGVQQDFSEAARWFRKAAERGYANAQNNLGESYFNGTGVPKSDTKAVEWYRKAAEQGHPGGQNWKRQPRSVQFSPRTPRPAPSGM
jgi:TPR repeat protein